MSELYEFDDDPAGLAARVKRTLTAVRDHASASCASCGRAVCGHEVVFSLVVGAENSQTCLDCEAARQSRDRRELRDALTMFVQSKPCLSQGWRYASILEGYPAEAAPACLFGAAESRTTPPDDRVAPTDDEVDEIPAATDQFDAGDQGCGDLVLVLRIRMNRMPPGSILDLRALDPGAPADIPAWCRLTGHRLLAARHPHYYIRRKDD